MQISVRAALLAACLGVAIPLAAPVFAQDSGGALRPVVGKPLTKAKALLAAHNYAGAMAALRQADAVRDKTAGESFVIEEMRGAIAQASGDLPTAEHTYQAMIESGRVPAAESLKLMEAEASMAYQQQDYAHVASWTERYLKAGGNDPSMRTLLITAYYLQKDYANAGRLQAAQIAAIEKARQKPTEQELQLLANCQEQLGDKPGFAATMMKLVASYPKPDYWLNVIHATQTAPGFSDRLAFDVDRLEFQLGTFTKADEYLEMTLLALQAPLPGEAKAIIDKGFAVNLLGQGPEAPRHARLKALVAKTYADELAKLPATAAAAAGDRDGNRLLAAGEEMVSYGQFDTGIAAMQAGIAKDQLRHPEDAKLHLGLAYMKAGQTAQAVATLKTVGGTDGTAALAQLWVLYLTTAQPPAKP